MNFNFGDYPIELKKGNILKVTGKKSSDKHINQCIYRLVIDYTDSFGNEYILYVNGQGSKVINFKSKDKPSNK